VYILRRLFLLFFLVTLAHVERASADEPTQKEVVKEWKISAGTGVIVAPAFVGAKAYSLLAVPDIRILYKDRFFANVKDGVGYAIIACDGWRIGPVVSYSFGRSEKDGGSIFRIAGGGKGALEGMGDVPGSLLLGGFVEYSLKPYKAKLHLHKGVTGHDGMIGEAGFSYGGVMTYNGPPLIYSFGPHVKFGDQKYTNAYWGISPEQSSRTGLDQYHADAGVTAYGVNAFALIPLTKSVSVSAIAGFDRLARPATNSPLVRSRGTENQAITGLFVSYGF
jgi:outer membrane scaffolding protein for murein synthesis (MipA/OmpV family)